MPNTLAHLGVGGVVTRAVISGADLKWVYLGCLIPDVPWIIRRAIVALPVEWDPYDLRLYAISQSTLAGCLILSAAFACASRAGCRVFAVLALNSLSHLILDAAQTKWGNGVNLFAPFSWTSWNFGLFWPESPVTYLLTLFGLAYFALHWSRGSGNRVRIAWRRREQLAAAGLLIAAYCGVPFLMQGVAGQADNHFVATLREQHRRTGRFVEFDRSWCYQRSGSSRLKTFAGEEIGLVAVEVPTSSRCSVRGKFLDAKRVHVLQFHEHGHGFRDFASIVGLGLVASYWLIPRGSRDTHPQS